MCIENKEIYVQKGAFWNEELVIFDLNFEIKEQLQLVRAIALSKCKNFLAISTEREKILIRDNSEGRIVDEFTCELLC